MLSWKQCALPVITTMALQQFMQLGTWCTIYQNTRTLHAKVHELPQSHCCDNREGTLFSFTENVLIFIWFMLWLQRNLLYSFEAPGTDYKRLKKLTSFNNTTLNKRIVKALASWMFRILSLFDFRKIDCGKALEILSQCLYCCIRYYWVGVKQFSINDIANNHKFPKFLTSWIFKKSFWLFGACIIDNFGTNWFTNLKQAWIYLH